jgi:hypothetical protein
VIPGAGAGRIGQNERAEAAAADIECIAAVDPPRDDGEDIVLGLYPHAGLCLEMSC